MSHIDDRLRAADPVAGRAYQHPNLDEMIARISAPSLAPISAQWRAFKVRMAAAVAIASAGTVGAIALLQAAAPSLSVLVLAAASTGAQSPAAGTAMMTYEEFQFTAGPNLGTGPSLGAAYRIQSPANGLDEAARISSIFGVSGTPQTLSGSGTDWTVTDPSGSTLAYQVYGGVASWNFNSSSSIASSAVTSGPPAVAAPPSSVAVPPTSTLENDARHYMKELGYGYTLTDPTFSTQSITTGTTSDTSSTTMSEETVSYVVAVDGTPTSQAVQFTVDAANTLVDASGPAFSVDSSTNYPLRRPVDGVAALNAEQQQRFAPSNGTAVTPDTSNGGSVSPPGAATPATGSAAPGSPAGPTTTTTPTPPPGPPIVDVTLNGVTVTLGAYQLDNGTVYLVPMYSYSGEATGPDGNTYTGSWSAIAVDPAYVHFNPASAGGVINY